MIATTPIVTDRHATDHFLAPLASLAIYDADAVPQLNVQLKNAAQIPPLPPPAVALHPGSGSRKKNWPLENFLRLADLLAEKTHLQPVWITAEAEQEYIPHLDDQLTDRRRLHALPLEQLAAALATCALFIGNDGGISHLAAATGCPTVTLFGPSPAPLWQPRGRKVLTIQSPDDRMASLTTDEVWRTLQTWLKSLPTSLSMDT